MLHCEELHIIKGWGLPSDIAVLLHAEARNSCNACGAAGVVAVSVLTLSSVAEQSLTCLSSHCHCIIV